MTKQRLLMLGYAVLFLFVFAISTGSPRNVSRPDHRREAREPSHRTATVSDADLERMYDARDALRVLVETHPEPAISQDLNRMVIDGTVSLNFQELDVLENNGTVAAAILINVGGDLRLTLAVSPSMLLDPEQPYAFKQLVVYHEYIHIRQQLEHRYPAWLMIGLDTRAMTDDDIRTFISAEMEAYVAECQLAERIDATDAFELCRVYTRDGEQALRVAFSQTMANGPAYALIAERVLRIGQETN